MWSFLSKSKVQDKLQLKIDGMHCVSCGLNIDGAVEELPGVTKSQTDYAHGKTNIDYDSTQVTPEQIAITIEKLGYKTTPSR